MEKSQEESSKTTCAFLKSWKIRECFLDFIDGNTIITLYRVNHQFNRALLFNKQSDLLQMRDKYNTQCLSVAKKQLEIEEKASEAQRKL